MTATNRVALPDVNVLVTLFDPDRVRHDIAQDWLGDMCPHGKRRRSYSLECQRYTGLTNRPSSSDHLIVHFVNGNDVSTET
jgi:predicted nucleic acid-binding protein